MTTPYNQLRQLLTDRLPHLTRLVANGASTRANAQAIYMTDEPNLQDILLAIDSKGGTNCGLAQHLGKLKIWGNVEMIICYYDLTKSPKDQTDETLLAIIELLK